MNRFKNVVAKRLCLTLACVAAVGLACHALIAADEKAAATAPAMTNKQVMQKAFKPENALVKTISAGKADEAGLKEFLGYAEALHANTPKKGDQAAWKERTKALVDATQDLIDKKEGAQAAFKTAVNCATCHNAFNK